MSRRMLGFLLLILVFAGVACSSPQADLVIRNGLLIDGLGNPPVVMDLAVDSGKIVAIERNSPITGRREIDASGLAVSPGFKLWLTCQAP